MNTIDELMDKGIGRGTAERILSDYSSRVGTRNGIYEITDINYDFHSHGKVVALKCIECGRELSRVMISGRNKWNELIKTCPCEKNKKLDEQEEILKNLKKQKSLFIRARIGKTYGDYVIAGIDTSECEYTLRCLECGNEIKIPVATFERRKNFQCKKHYVQQIKFDESYIGKKNNYLTVVSLTRFPNNNHKAFLCECDCGNMKMIEPFMWENGIIKSCGCYSESIKLEHSAELDRLRRIYSGMLQRCYNENSHAYEYYGGRGISVCDDWLSDRAKFIKWALQNGYENELTIDRIDVNGNYEPDNCRWADWSTQANNRRKSKERKMRRQKTAFVNGIERPLSEWYVIYGITAPAVAYRIKKYGLDFESALTMPRVASGRPRKEV